MVSCARATRGLGRPSLGLMARLGVPVGGRVRKLRAVGDESSPPSREKVEEQWSSDACSKGQPWREKKVPGTNIPSTMQAGEEDEPENLDILYF